MHHIVVEMMALNTKLNLQLILTEVTDALTGENVISTHVYRVCLNKL